uniref:Sin3 C-terminal domain-containing protein n=1 Tax=Corethron hystrix TaxID=216773 RepID=A0A7S1BCU2_9STRA
MGPIHINSIARIYGEHGQEMVNLLFKNPAKTIPVILRRLRQKDLEWRTARQILMKRWKEQNEQNYYRSLDHRSSYWRQQDKKHTSTRALVHEIKDRAAHGGHEGKQLLHAKKEKAKEEHGSFYEVTNGNWVKKLRGRGLALHAIAAPTKTLFTPHLSFGYKSVSSFSRDAHRLLTFATEKGTLGPNDRERMHRMWRDFLNPFFNVPEGRVSLIGEDEDPPEDPIPPGVPVSTLYGEGTVVEYRPQDGFYKIQFAWGKGFLRPAAVLCSIMPVEESSVTSCYRRADTETLSERSQLMFGTQSLYLFLRLHHLLVERLAKARSYAEGRGGEVQVVTPGLALGTASPVEKRLLEDTRTEYGQERYDAYLSILYGLVDGHNASGENLRYEEKVRSLLGNDSCELYTMDKLINHTLKHLQAMSSDETFSQMVQVYRRHAKTGVFKPTAFRQEIATLSYDDVYAFQFCKVKDARRKHGYEAIIHMEYFGLLSEMEEIHMGYNGVMNDATMVDVDYDRDGGSSNKRQRR